MPAKAGQIVIDITAGTSKFVVDMDKAKAKIREFGQEAHGSVSGVQAVSGTLRVMEGNITNNLRAAERWVASLPGVANALKVAFPVVGAIAFGGVITELGTKINDFFREIQEAPAKIANAFREINVGARLSNDLLQLANDKLEADIARLQGKRENNVAIALDEAKVAADELAKSLDADIEKMQKLAEEQSLGFLKGMVSNQRSTDGNDEGLARFRDSIARAMATGNNNIRAAGTDTGARDAAETTRNTQLQKLYNDEISRRNVLLVEAQKLQDYHDGKNQAPTYQQYVHAPNGTYAPYGVQATTPDQTVFIKQQQGTIEQLQYQLDSIGLMATSEKDKTKKGELEANKSANEAAARASNAALEETARLSKDVADARASQLKTMDRIYAEENNELQIMAAAGTATKENLDLLDQKYDLKRVEAYNKTMQETVSIHLSLSSAMKKVTTEEATAALYGPKFAEAAKELEEHAKASAKWAEDYNRITAQTAAESLRHRVTMAGATGSASDPLGTLATQQAIERADIEARYEQILKGELSDQDRSNLIRQKALDLQKLQYEMEERTAAARHKNLADFMREMQGDTKTAGDILYAAANPHFSR